MVVYKPAWFTDGKVFVSFAPTVGINKDGEELYVVDPASGARTETIDDQIALDVDGLIDSDELTPTSRWVDEKFLTERLIAVPNYFDQRPSEEFDALMDSSAMAGFGSRTIGELVDDGTLVAKFGHGSPSADLRTGDIPYIKVSDLRAGQVNINPTNRVSSTVAEKFWKGSSSGLKGFDLLTPIRTSKNIGEFAVLMPGQERVVLTKEILILRSGPDAEFDNFYLLWAMTLVAVRKQWNRIVFMQTNREDVGLRYREIRLPVPSTREAADECSHAFRQYYIGTSTLRDNLWRYLDSDSKHYVFMASSISPETELVEDIEELEVVDHDAEDEGE